MNMIRLSVAHMRFKKLSSLFNVMVLALGVATILTLLNIGDQLEQRFQRDLQGIDLVVGAKGSPLQLILSSVFHLDIPNGNIPLGEAEKLKANPFVASAIPVALGDNYNGFRIVGTTVDYIRHYSGELAQGRLYGAPMEAVLGSDAARGVKLGEAIIGAHGLVSSDDLHTDFPYKVVGILAPTGSVIDRLVLTPVESVWHVHEHPDPDDAAEVEAAKHRQGNEITALLISYTTPMAAVTLPRLVNKSTSMQAASPAFEVARLMKILGVGGDAVTMFGGLLVVLAGVGCFIVLWSTVEERKYDIALLRSMGATRGKVFALVLCEGMGIGVAGAVLGVGLSHALSYGAGVWMERTRHMALAGAGWHGYEAWAVLIALAISAIAAIIPAVTAYRVNVATILARGS